MISRAALLLVAAVVSSCPEDPGSKAIRSPVVFHGRLVALTEEDLKVTGVFKVQKVWKTSEDLSMMRKDPVTVDFWRNSSKCGHSLVQDLTVEQRYFVFAAYNRRTAVLRAVAPTTEFSRRSSRFIRKAICPGCAKPPTVRGLGDSQVETRKRLKLKCKLSGNPPPHVDWYRDGRKLRAKGRVKIRTKRKYSKLEISQVRPQDSGLYECRAVNVVAEHYASAKARVTVVEKGGDIRPPAPQPTNDSALWPLKGRPCPINSFCLNGGACSYYETVGEYVCQCAEGYRGQRCESKDIYTLGILEGNQSSYPLLLSAVIVLAVLLFLTCLAVGCYILCRHCHLTRRRKREFASSSSDNHEFIGFAPLKFHQSNWQSSESTASQQRSPLCATVDPTPKFRQRLMGSSSTSNLQCENSEAQFEIFKNSEMADPAEIVHFIEAAFRKYR